jgi:hypothetical protein
MYPAILWKGFGRRRYTRAYLARFGYTRNPHSIWVDKSIFTERTGNGTNTKQIYINTEKTTDPDYYLNVLKTNIGYFYI